MAVKAMEAEQGRIYRATRGAWKGAYFTVSPLTTEKLVKRLARRRDRLNGRECGLLALAVRHPDWPVFVWHLRGIDPFTNQRFEIKRTMVLPPDTRLREVQSKPGYR